MVGMVAVDGHSYFLGNDLSWGGEKITVIIGVLDTIH